MKLYSYWRSSAAYRVRIALNLKGIRAEQVPIELMRGQQQATDYLALNPGGTVPTLETEEGPILQSLAAIEYIEAIQPEPRLIPEAPFEAARVRDLALMIAADLHPLNNLRVTRRLQELGHDQQAVIDWMLHWMKRGLGAYQAALPQGTRFSCGDAPSLADVCLVPQLYNARRWGLDLSPLSRLVEIETLCLSLPAFADARPEVQPDAEP